MDLRRLGMMIALSCLVAAPYPMLADGAAKGRGDPQPAGDRGAAARRQAVVTSGARECAAAGDRRQERGARADDASARRLGATGSCGTACRGLRRPESPENQPAGSFRARSRSRAIDAGRLCRIVSIKPLQPSAAPQGSWASPRGRASTRGRPANRAGLRGRFLCRDCEEVNRPRVD